MITIDEVCKFTMKTDSVSFTTDTNGDTLTMSKLNLSKEDAASMAWMIKTMPQPS